MPIHLDLGSIVSALTIIGILATWLHYAVIRPIKTVLYAIEKQVEKLNLQVEEAQKTQTYLFEQIGRLDESLRSAHHRINEIKEECRLWHTKP